VSQPTHAPDVLRRARLGDFTLSNGEVLRDLEQVFTVTGDLDRHRDHVFVALHSFGGNHKRMSYLVGSGKSIDPQHCCVVAVNAIGSGLSSSPSLPGPQQGLTFPAFSVADMVRAARELLRQVLRVERVRCLVGASMGGMQALMWGTLFPTEVDAIVAVMPLARTPAWTRALNEVSRRVLQLDPTFAADPLVGGAEGMRVLTALRSGLAVNTPESLQTLLPDPTQAAAWLDERIATSGGMHPLDWLYTSRAYDDFDLGHAVPGGAGYREVLGTMPVPALIVAAEGDLLNPEADANEIAARLPDAELFTLGGDVPMGHAAGGATFERAARQQNAAVDAFLGRRLAPPRTSFA
jgi:homoserine O-acetyltransferase